MVEIYSIISLIAGIFFVSLSLIRLHRQSISQGTFVIWILVGLAGIIVAIVPLSIFTIQKIVGTSFTLSAVFGVSFIFLLILVFYLHQKVDTLNGRITKLIAALGASKFYGFEQDNKER